MTAPVSFLWTMPNDPLKSGVGITRDIDPAGAYITSRELPTVGALVQIDISLADLVDGRPGARLIGEGVVLRVDTNQGISSSRDGGFAVSVCFYLETSETVLSHMEHSEQVM